MRSRPPLLVHKPPSGEQNTTGRILKISLPLETITSVVGGGVEAREPDEVDVVRVHGIRGQLRGFWRAIQPMRSASALFTAEKALWGGVDGSEEEQAAERSRVEVSVQDVQAGRISPAGDHLRSRDGSKLNAFARWDGGDAFGYGLFPLQREKTELAAAGQANQLPTGSVRRDLTFTLQIALRPKAPAKTPAKEGAARINDDQALQKEADDLLRALWLWIHVGGLGARTTRGFGGLTPASTMKLEVDSTRGALLTPAWQQDWVARFDTNRPFKARLAALETSWSKADPSASSNNTDLPPVPWAHLSGARILVGQQVPNAGEAHRRLLALLQEMRQGKGTGRNPGQGDRPGRSYWPEADWLRTTVKDGYEQRHRPRAGDNARYPAPRAAFGMPIVVQFQGSKEKAADGEIVPDGYSGGRFTSPLRLTVVKEGSAYLPVVLAFPQRVQQVKIKRKAGKEATAGITGALGAEAPIKDLLTRGNPQDGVGAFLKWIEGKGYQELLPTTGQRGGAR